MHSAKRMPGSWPAEYIEQVYLLSAAADETGFLIAFSYPIHSFGPRPHYTVFKRKRYCFVPDTATVHTTTVRKRIISKTLSRVERFENGTV